MILFEMFIWVLFILLVLSLPYAGWILVNTLVLIGTVPKDILLFQALRNTNYQIQALLHCFYPREQEAVDDYTGFHNYLIGVAPKFGIDYLNFTEYANGVQRLGYDYYIWFSKKPEQNLLDDWIIEVRQFVRKTYKELDVLDTWIEEGSFLKLKINLVSISLYNELKHGQPTSLYSDKGEI